MKDNTGCYKCKKCKTYIRVLTQSRHQGWTYPRIIHNCPHCLSKDFKMIDLKDFRELEHSLWIKVIKEGINYSLKWKQ